MIPSWKKDINKKLGHFRGDFIELPVVHIALGGSVSYLPHYQSDLFFFFLC